MHPLRLVVRKTAEFDAWYCALAGTLRTRIDARLENLKVGHFGDSRALGNSLFELRWKNGMRVYYSRKRVRGIDLIVIWGGFKRSQQSDIAKAARIKERYEREI